MEIDFFLVSSHVRSAFLISFFQNLKKSCLGVENIEDLVGIDENTIETV